MASDDTVKTREGKKGRRLSFNNTDPPPIWQKERVQLLLLFVDKEGSVIDPPFPVRLKEDKSLEGVAERVDARDEKE